MKNMKKFPWICSFAAICVAVFMFVGVALAAEATPESAAKELTLDEAIKLALTNNPAGQIAVFDFLHRFVLGGVFCRAAISSPAPSARFPSRRA